MSIDFVPEAWKELTSKGRYERLVGHVSVLHWQVEVMGALIARYKEPKEASWQVPTLEELQKAHKEAAAAIGTFRRKLRKSEIDLISKPWAV